MTKYEEEYERLTQGIVDITDEVKDPDDIEALYAAAAAANLQPSRPNRKARRQFVRGLNREARQDYGFGRVRKGLVERG